MSGEKMTSQDLASTPEPLTVPEAAVNAEGPFADWLPLDPDNLPDSRLGPFLTTNNVTARNAHGMPSHVQLVRMFHKTDGAEGPVCAFNCADRKLWSLTHYRPVFAHG